MAKRHYPVKELARDANLSVDDALLRLFDEDKFASLDESSSVENKHLKTAKRLLGIANRSNLTSQEYWQRRLSLDDPDFQILLARLGIVTLPGSRRLPKGAVAKLKTELGRVQSQKINLSRESTHVVAQQIIPEFQWHSVGANRDIRFLSSHVLREIHYALVEDFINYGEPISPAGVSSENLLEAAAQRPHTSLGDNHKYPTVEMASAALVHSLVHDHPFHNGNKRTALVAMLVFLDENGVMLTCDEDLLFEFVLQVAKHKIVDQHHRRYFADREVIEMAHWVRRNTRLVEKGDRSIPFRRLRQILHDYDCMINDPIGSQVKITRKPAPRRFSFFKPRELSTQVHYYDEGRDVGQNTVSKIRRDLQLNEENGIDSRTFYEKAPASASDFIIVYRKTLHRLAKL